MTTVVSHLKEWLANPQHITVPGILHNTTTWLVILLKLQRTEVLDMKMDLMHLTRMFSSLSIVYMKFRSISHEIHRSTCSPQTYPLQKRGKTLDIT
jgi:hypothetical protein